MTPLALPCQCCCHAHAFTYHLWPHHTCITLSQSHKYCHLMDPQKSQLKHSGKGCKWFQCISIAGSDSLTDNALKDLTFLLYELTGVFTTAICHVANQQMLIEFCLHFTSKNKECLHKLISSQAGFHSANVAFIKSLATNWPPQTAAPLLAPTPPAPNTTQPCHHQ